MLIIELALGIAVAAVFLAIFFVALHIVFWIFFALLVVVALAVLVFNFPLAVIGTVLVIALAFVGLFQMLLTIGRSTRKYFSRPLFPPDKELPK